MRFRPCVDFFRKRNRHLLTFQGKKKTQQIKLTGIKIAYFFKIDLNYPDEEEPLDEDQQTEYQIWSKIFGFIYMPKRNAQKQEEYRKIEEIIKSYAERNLGKTWINYPINKYDIFEDHDLLGGVPDGEERDNNGNTASIIEIKTITQMPHQEKSPSRFTYPSINYQLQLGLYCFLRGIDVGYICLCFLKPENWKSSDTIRLTTPLEKYSNETRTFSGSITSCVKSIGQCPYEYTILESYCNNGLEDNEVIIFKIKINMEKYKELLDRLQNWFIKHREVSPEMEPEELKKMLGRNRNL